MQRGRAGRGVPSQLGVVVGVYVDEPWRHHQTRRVQAAPGRLIGRSHAGYQTVLDPDVNYPSRRAGTVDDGTPSDQKVKHLRRPVDRRKLTAADATVAALPM